MPKVRKLSVEEVQRLEAQPDQEGGTGRLLLPLLRASIDIDGCDISGDMLQHCRRKATSEGFSPRLYEQPMHAFDIPRRYKTIYKGRFYGIKE